MSESALVGPKKTRLLDFSVFVGLAGLVAWLYRPALGYEFINWDDPWYVLNNELIKNWSLTNLWSILSEPVARNFAPLTIFSFLVDHTLWGENAAGYHGLNVVLHMINGWLVYQLLTQLTGSRLVAIGTAAVFIAHPVQIETVAWVSSRKGLLSAMFGLASLIYYLRPQTTGRQEFAALMLFLAALLCKAIAIVIPPIVVAYHVLVWRRGFADSVVRQIFPAFFASLLLLFTMSAQTTIVGGIRDHLEFSKTKILAIDAVIMWKYVATLFAPSNLCVLYDPPTEGISSTIRMAIIGWAVVAMVVVIARKKFPQTVFAGFCFVLLFVPVLNLFPLTTLMNDRYLYLPIIPFFAIVSATVVRLFQELVNRLPSIKSAQKRTALAGSMAAVVMMAGTLVYAEKTQQYLPVWKNSLSLWSYATQQTPTLPVTWIQLAYTLESEGRLEEAISILEKTQAMDLDKHDRRRIGESLYQWRAELAQKPNVQTQQL